MYRTVASSMCAVKSCSRIWLEKCVIQSRQLSSNHQTKNMVDPKRVVSYEDMLKVIHQPEKVIIDVRNKEEIKATGKIPSSINIPSSYLESLLLSVGEVQNILTSMSDEEFKKHFQRSKPSSSDELIFYCQSGRRSSEALDRALKLGYSKSKTYLGSWNDWSSRQQ